MRYIQPTITATYKALSSIKSEKVSPNNEINGAFLTTGAAYQANE